MLPESARQGYFAQWAEREREELEEIAESFPVPLLRAPLHSSELIGIPALGEFGEEIYGGRDPAQLFTTSRPIRLRKRGRRTLLEIDLPGMSKEEVDLVSTGQELHVRVRDARRRIALPTSLVGQPIESSPLREGVLEVVFGE